MAHHFLFRYFWGLPTWAKSSTFAPDFEGTKCNNI